MVLIFTLFYYFSLHVSSAFCLTVAHNKAYLIRGSRTPDLEPGPYRTINSYSM